MFAKTHWLSLNLYYSLAAFSGTALCADWPQFLGPTRDAVYNGSIPGKNPEKLWQMPVGAGFAGPVITQGKLVLFHRLNNRETLEALDVKSGTKVWSFSYETLYRDDFGFDEGPRAAPVVSGGKVYTHGAEGMLTCVDFATGKKVWQVDTRAQFKFPKGFFGAAAVPLVEGDKLILNVGGPQLAGIVAFNKDTGKVMWGATNDEAGYSSPVAATIGGVRHVLVLTRAGLVSLDPAKGQLRFRLPWRSRNDASVNAAVPVVVNDLVFISSSYRTGATVLQVTSPASFKQLWSGDESLSNHYATSVQKDGYLYGYHGRQENGQTLRCIDMKTGKVMWEVEEFGAGTLILAGSDLLLMRESGELAWGTADPKGAKAGPRKQLLPGVVRAYPALADGVLCARNTSTLGCWGLK
jgi:outer membrane protein assembly factor BamB